MNSGFTNLPQFSHQYQRIPTNQLIQFPYQLLPTALPGRFHTIPRVRVATGDNYYRSADK